MRTMRNFLATLAFSQGVPMISHGDEIARTQRGNNNAYAQDNELSWVNWELDDRRRDLLEFARTVFAIRHANPVLRRRSFFRGRPVGHGVHKDVTWVRTDGDELTWEDWHDDSLKVLGMLVHGEASDETDDRGRPVRGDTMLLVLNAGDVPVQFSPPPVEGHLRWVELVNTHEPKRREPRTGAVLVQPLSLVLLRYGADRRLAEEAAPVREMTRPYPAMLPRATDAAGRSAP